MERYPVETAFRAVGRDQITFQGEELIVFAAVEMPDWYVKNYRKLAIYFEGERYFVAERTLLQATSGQSLGYRVRYTLQRWPDDLNDFPGGSMEYHEDYVRARDEALAQNARAHYINLTLLPLQPFIGLLPSKLKTKLEDSFGVDIARATALSLWLEYLFLFAHAGMAIIGMFTTMFNIYYLIAAIFIVLPDALVRYDNMMREGEINYGFYEWLFHLKLS